MWLLQRVAEMVRNFALIDVSWPTLRRSWLGIFRRASVVSYKIFAMVVVTCKRQEQRETIVGEQRDMDIGKAADAVVESEYEQHASRRSQKLTSQSTKVTLDRFQFCQLYQRFMND